MTSAPLAFEPDLRAIHSHLAWIASPAQSSNLGLRVEIAWSDFDSGPNRGRTFGVNELNEAAGFAAWINRKGCNVYVGATLKSADAALKGRTRAEHAALATGLPIDVDIKFVASATKLATIAKPQFLVLTGHRPEARGQLLVRIGSSTDLASWEVLQAHAVHYCGGDENALGRNRLMRLAGTVSYPSPAKAMRGYTVEGTTAHFIRAPQYDLLELLSALQSLVIRKPVVPFPPLPAQAALSIARQARSPRPSAKAVASALCALPDRFAVEQQLWIKVGFALHDFDCSPKGLSLWEHFSQRCPDKAKATDFNKLWRGFGRSYKGRRLTIKWLLREASCPSPFDRRA